MHNLSPLAVGAVKARCEDSPLYNEYLIELERSCHSREELKYLITRAEAIVLPPLMPRVLRVLKRAAKSARRGEGERCEQLHALACRMVGKAEVASLSEEHRLSFIVQRPIEEPKPSFSYGFVPAC